MEDCVKGYRLYRKLCPQIKVNRLEGVGVLSESHVVLVHREI